MQDGIRNKNEVEGVLRAAQDQVLDRNEPGACLFSRNTVVLEIRGAPVSLSLVSVKWRTAGLAVCLVVSAQRG